MEDLRGWAEHVVTICMHVGGYQYNVDGVLKVSPSLSMFECELEGGGTLFFKREDIEWHGRMTITLKRK